MQELDHVVTDRLQRLRVTAAVATLNLPIYEAAIRPESSGLAARATEKTHYMFC
jgi:hypothetical protein